MPVPNILGMSGETYSLCITLSSGQLTHIPLTRRLDFYLSVMVSVETR